MRNLTAEKIMKRILGTAQQIDTARSAQTATFAAEVGTAASGSTQIEEAARIVQTLIDGGRALPVDKLERLDTVPDNGLTLPIVSGGKLKTLGTDAIMAKLNDNFRKELDRLVVGQVPIITDPEIDDITDNDIDNNN